MAKLTLKPNPTFVSLVLIPVAGEAPARVAFTFKYRTASELASISSDIQEAKSEVDSVFLVASGWDLDDEFTPENVGLLVDQRPGAARAIFETYFKEVYGVREKN